MYIRVVLSDQVPAPAEAYAVRKTRDHVVLTLDQGLSPWRMAEIVAELRRRLRRPPV